MFGQSIFLRFFLVSKYIFAVENVPYTGLQGHMFEVSREREYICKVIWLDRLFCHYHDTLNVIQWRGFNTTWEGAWFRDAPANKWCPCGLSRHAATCPTYADLHTQPHARATFMPISIRPVLKLVPPFMHQLPLSQLLSSESIHNAITERFRDWCFAKFP